MRPELNLSSRSIGNYLSELSSGNPTPGGGSAAGVAGAMGCALGAMVCNLTLGKQRDDTLSELASHFTSMAQQLIALSEDDERVFAAYRVAAAMPRSNDNEKAARRLAVDAALVAAAKVPLEMIEVGKSALDDLVRAAMLATPHALGDLMTGGHLIQAMTLGSLENVKANAASMRNIDNRSRFERASLAAPVLLDKQLDALREACAARQKA